MDDRAQRIIDNINEFNREHGPFPKEVEGLGIKLKVSDLDMDGERGGTEYTITHCFKYRVTQGKNEFIAEALKPYDIIESNMVINHG